MIIDSGVITGSLQVSGSLTVTGSSNLQGDVRITGSLSVSGPISGAITGSITNAVSASYALNASTADSATSASRATSAANADNATSASFATTAATASIALSISSSISSQNLQHNVLFVDTTGPGLIQVDGGLRYNPNTNLLTTTASLASLAETASYATTAPFYVLTSSYNTDSSSLSTRTTNLESTASTLTTASASFALVSASYSTASGSISTRETNLESTASTLTSASASFASSINGITSVYATTGSNTFTGTQYISNDTNATNFVSTAALYTDGGLRVSKDSFISGGLSIAGNLTVYGTSSVNYITSSTLLGLEFLELNTTLPALRYAGINIGDSGSAAGISSSFWYDSAKDNWLYVYAPAGSGQQTSSLAINGPIAYNNVGNEQGLLGNYVVKSQLVTADNNHHITSSQIFDDGTTVAIAGNLQVTGSLRAANLTGSLNGSNLVDASVANAKLTNSTISGIALGSNLATLTIGTGLSGTSYNGSTAVTIANTGVTSAVAGTAISVSGATGAVTITNTGVTSNVAGTGVTVSGATGAVTISIGQAVGTASNVQFNSLGVGTAGSAVAGEIRATADVTAFYSSDERLKEDITPIENPIEKLMSINGVTFSWKEGFETIHSHVGSDTGVVAQQIEAIQLPGVVTTRETGYMAVNYEKLNALLIEGFKAHQKEINELKELVNTLLNK